MCYGTANGGQALLVVGKRLIFQHNTLLESWIRFCETSGFFLCVVGNVLSKAQVNTRLLVNNGDADRPITMPTQI
jgi:hypothetical protein